MSNSDNVPLVPSLQFERDLLAEGYDFVIGLDEVGRGSLAGVVMVGAAIVGSEQVETEDIPQGLADSKLLTEHRRENLISPLKNWCTSWAVGSCTNSEIDEWGISYALGVAALKAISEAETKLSNILSLEGKRIAAILDGPCDYIDKVLNTFDAPEVLIPAKIHTLVKADRKCASVAAAAVIAKVTRDNIMIQLSKDSRYCTYEWDKNKGYGSKAHREAISKYGPSDLHRLSWHLS